MSESCVSLTIPIRAGEIKKGMNVILKGFPCKVISISTSKTGKHGHAKANITGTDIFTGKKYIDMCPTSHNMQQPVIKTSTYNLSHIDEDNYCFLLDENFTMREDIKLPNESSPDKTLGENIKKYLDKEEEINVTVIEGMNEAAIIGYKVL